jgi:signal transduction histidine kinase
MITVDNYITHDYVTANPYDTAEHYKQFLLRRTPVVVKENGIFLGILTLEDLLRHPDRSAGHSLSEKPFAETSQSAWIVLQRMCDHHTDFVPVMHGGVFHGLLAKDDLLKACLANNCNDYAAKQRIDELNRELSSKNKFLSLIGHDIRNLFNQVLGGLELLEARLQYRTDEKTQSVLRMAKRAAVQVNAAFESMLLWARLGSGQLSFNPELLSVSKEFDRIIPQFQLAGSAKGITLKSKLQHDLPIYADRNMVNCIFLNLVYNAIKFTPSGGEVWLDAHKHSKFTEIIIADNGTGMSSLQQKRLFNESKSTAGTLNEPGTGLGLIICKEFVEKNKGTIDVQSNLDQGTKVILRLPSGPMDSPA